MDCPVQRQIESNDPGLTSLIIGLNDHCPPQFLVGDDDNWVELWENLGADVARNTHITELVVGDFRDHEIAQMDEYLEAFFRGAVGNRSIKELNLGGTYRLNSGRHPPNWRSFSATFICKSLAEFLATNGKIEKLAVGGFRDEHRCEQIFALASALRAFDCLASFSTGNLFPVQGMDAEFQQLMQALSGHTDLRRLNLSNNETIADSHCVAIATSLMGPNSKLEELKLRRNEIGDEGIKHLSRALGNNTLRDLNISNNRQITAYGWEDFMRALSPVLQLPNCALTALDLEVCHEMDDDAVAILANSLKSNTSVKELNLRCNLGVNRYGWAAFSEAVAHFPVEELDIGDNSFDDGDMLSLTRSLVNNSKMKTLRLQRTLGRSTEGVTARGWSAFSRVLSSPESVLEDLDISDNALGDDTLASIATSLTGNTTLKAIGLCRTEMNDGTLASLANALVVNTRVKRLELFCNQNVTSDGWAAFAQILSPALRNNTSALERIHMAENSVGDGAAIHFANALVSNNKLKELQLDAEDSQISSDGWSAFARTLGNASSIADTYNSNHTLETLVEWNVDLPEDVETYLDMNRSFSNSQAARLKIIEIHFLDGFATQPFVGMDMKVLPHALAWMAREGGEFGHVWEFVKSMPLLFRVGSDGKKRKRSG